METTVRFGLPINGARVFYLEQLKDNFVLSELMQHFRSEILQNWLKQRDFEDKLDEIESWDEYLDDDELKEKLIELFEVEPDQVKADFGNIDEDEMVFSLYDRIHLEYKKLTESIVSHPESKSKLKPELDVLMNKYFELFKMDTFSTAVKHFPLIFLMLLGYKDFWALYGFLDEDEVNVDVKQTFIKLMPKFTGEDLSEDELMSQLDEVFSDEYGKYFTEVTFKKGFNPADDGYADIMFDSGKYLVWVDDPDDVEIFSVNDEECLTFGKLNLSFGLAYRCYGDEAKAYFLKL